MRANRARIAKTCVTIVLTTMFCSIFRPEAFAQTSGQSQNSAVDSSARPAPDAGSSNQEILRELERMRARIQELEAQLKQQSTAATTSRTESSSLNGTTPNATTPAIPAAATPVLAVAGQSSEPAPVAKPGKEEPFAFADWTWLNGNPRTKQPAFDRKFFTPEIRADVDYVYDFNHPKDDTIGGSSEVFRSDEVHVDADRRRRRLPL